MTPIRWTVRWTQFGHVGWRVFEAAHRASALGEARRLYRSAKARGERVILAIRVERDDGTGPVMVYNEDSPEIRDGAEPAPEPTEPEATDVATPMQAIAAIHDVLARFKNGEIDEAGAKRELMAHCGKAPSTPLLRSADGVDAGAYVVSEPLTVEAVRGRAAVLRDARVEFASPTDNARRAKFYADVLRTISADRGPLGDLARAALAAEE